jgi:hypothetical protein
VPSLKHSRMQLAIFYVADYSTLNIQHGSVVKVYSAI